MTLTVLMRGSMYDCKLKITDVQGTRYYLLPLADDVCPSITVDVFDDAFDLEVLPLMPDVQQLLDEVETNSRKEKFAVGVTRALSAIADHMLLRVGCRYHITDLQDGDRLDVELQEYPFGLFDRFGLLELLPMIHMFFEVSCFGKRYEPIDAFETNRKDVLRAAKMMAFSGGIGNGCLWGLISYPIQMGRAKWLSSHHTIRRTVLKFHRMSDAERERLMEQLDKTW